MAIFVDLVSSKPFKLHGQVKGSLQKKRDKCHTLWGGGGGGGSEARVTFVTLFLEASLS